MADPILAALTARRAELIAEARAADAMLRRLLADIEHLEEAMRVYDPVNRPRKVQINRAQAVDISRTSLNILRQAKTPMPLRDIAFAVLATQSKDQTDAKLVQAVVERVRMALIRQRNVGTLRSIPGPGQLLLWEVA